jgi:dipeptidyl-peptidase 4
MSDTAAAIEPFPRQSARTRRFTAGAPRLFAVSPDGRRVLFVRSSHGTDVVGRLWELDAATGVEQLVADPTALHPGAEELSPAERARRERMREGNAGIVGYSVDDAFSTAVFALSGGLYAVDLDPIGPVRALDVPGPVIDPRIAPDGQHVAYVSGTSLRVCRLDGSADRALAEPEHELETCGLADFAAAEELERQRGSWWSPASGTVLVERVDTTPVQEWWIADPVHPEQAPRAHRYPAAGTPNALLSLELVALDGVVTPVTWDREAYEYLVDVVWQKDLDAVVVVATRDQRRHAVLALDAATGTTRLVDQVVDDAFIAPSAGAVRWSPDGVLLSLRPDPGSDTYRLRLGDTWLTPEGLQVSGILSSDAHGVLATVCPTPTSRSVVRVGWNGAIVWVTPEDGVNLAVSSGGTDVVVRRELSTTEVRFEVRTASATHAVVTHAERPVVTPSVTMLEAGERALRTAVLFPTGHVPGSRRLPVLLCPYGGPHASPEVLESLTAFGVSQWFADQGFAVIVSDGRGTPGRGPAWDRAVHRDLATPPLDDQVDALYAVAERFPDDLDLSRVAIRGWSFGGYLSALAVLRRPDVFHAAVAGAPVTEWRLYDTAYTERYLGDPRIDPAPYDDCSLPALAAGLRRPLLIVHGLTDDNVVVAHSLRLSAALTVAGRPHEVLPLSGVTHMTPQEEVAENKLLLELDFLRRSLELPPA